MKLAFALSTALAATNMAANAMEPKLLRLIGSDTRVVCGVDMERYRGSALAAIYPSGLEWLSTRSGMNGIRQVITILNADRMGPPLTVLSGAITRSPTADDPGSTLVPYHGYSVLSNPEFGSMARLDSTTVIMGAPDRVKEAIDHWGDQVRDTPDIAATAQRLSGSYDLWFLAVRPLDLDRAETAQVLTYRDELVQVIEEVRGGVRLGVSDEVSVEVLARTADDATTLAALGRWLPGFIQLQEPSGPVGSLVPLAENLSVRTEGRTAVASFSIPESALEKLPAAGRLID